MLTISAAPEPARKSTESQRGPGENPKAIIQMPQQIIASTTPNPWREIRLIRPVKGVRATAPIEVAASNKPKPWGPICRISLAYTGRSARGEPKKVAKKSSERTARMIGCARRKRIPSTNAPTPACARFSTGTRGMTIRSSEAITTI